MAAKKGADTKKAKKPEVVTREYTIHLHKRVHSVYVFFELRVLAEEWRLNYLDWFIV